MFPTEMSGTYCNEGKMFIEKKEKKLEMYRKKEKSEFEWNNK